MYKNSSALFDLFDPVIPSESFAHPLNTNKKIKTIVYNLFIFIS